MEDEVGIFMGTRKQLVGICDATSLGCICVLYFYSAKQLMGTRLLPLRVLSKLSKQQKCGTI
jgi:hypothetical protein